MTGTHTDHSGFAPRILGRSMGDIGMAQRVSAAFWAALYYMGIAFVEAAAAALFALCTLAETLTVHRNGLHRSLAFGLTSTKQMC